MLAALRVGGIVALAVWLTGVSGLFGLGPTANWTALVIGLALLALAAGSARRSGAAS